MVVIRRIVHLPTRGPVVFTAVGRSLTFMDFLRKAISLFRRRWWPSPSIRRILVYLVLNLSFTFVELFYGHHSHSLSLLSDGFHMLFDSSVIIANLTLLTVSSQEPTAMFSFGYGRVEALAGVANSLLLLYAAIGIVMGALDRVFNPTIMETGKVMTVAVLGLVVNIVGIFAFNHGAAHHSGGGYPSDGLGGLKEELEMALIDDELHSTRVAQLRQCLNTDRILKDSDDYPEKYRKNGRTHHGHGHGHHHSHSHKSPLFHGIFQCHFGFSYGVGMFLHVIADTLGSIAVIITTWLTASFNWTLADPICSIGLSAIILTSAWPLFVNSLLIIMNHTPASVLRPLAIAMDRIRKMPGVLAVSDVHVWQHSGAILYGMVTIQIASGYDEHPLRLQALHHLTANLSGLLSPCIQMIRVDTANLVGQ